MESVPASNGDIPNGKPVMNGRSRHGLPSGAYNDNVTEEKAGLTETSFTTDDTSVLIPQEDSKPAPPPPAVSRGGVV